MARKTKEEASRTRELIIDAARRVFHQCGVGRSTLEKIAQAAGVTRGAVYWHFKDKAELFFAMREDVFRPMVERTDAILLSENHDDPLKAIEAALLEFFRVLDECPTLREVFEIMRLRCEYVDEFASVLAEANRPAMEFLGKVEKVYRRAKEKGRLRPDLAPDAAALDTWAFTGGLLQFLLSTHFESGLKSQVAAMIATHMALRRPVTL